MEIVEAAAVPTVGPRICGPSSAPPSATEQIGYDGLRVAPHEARDHGNASKAVLDMADVQAGNGCTACRIIGLGHALPLHDAIWSKANRLECAEEHLNMALEGFESAGQTYGAPEQRSTTGGSPLRVPADVEVGIHINVLWWVGIVRLGCDQADTILKEYVCKYNIVEYDIVYDFVCNLPLGFPLGNDVWADQKGSTAPWACH